MVGPSLHRISYAFVWELKRLKFYSMPSGSLESKRDKRQLKPRNLACEEARREVRYSKIGTPVSLGENRALKLTSRNESFAIATISGTGGRGAICR